MDQDIMELERDAPATPEHPELPDALMGMYYYG